MSLGLRAISCFALALPSAAQCFDPDQLLAPDGEAFDTFGWDIVADGGYLFVGAPRENSGGAEAGAVYIYDLADSSLHQKLLASDASVDSSFGLSLAVHGDFLVVGAPSFTPWTTGTPMGSAYVFTRVGGVWTETDKLTPSDGAADDQFGHDVAISGTTLFVSSVRDDDGATETGSVYAFDYQAPGWVESQKITAFNADKGDWFGNALAIDGDRAVITAIWAGAADDGLAYVFERAGGVWKHVISFSANPHYQDQFGQSVALQGSTILVGYPHYSASPADSKRGLVLVYEETAGVWSKTQEMAPTIPINESHFGLAVDLEGSYALIGAGAQWGGHTDPGYAYLFEKTDSGFEEVAVYQDPNGDNRDRFGGSVSMDGLTLCISAYWDDELGEDSGSVWSYSHSPGIEIFCICDTAAPCGNVDPEAGCSNSSGFGGRLTGCGSTSVSVDDLILTGSQLPPTQFGLLFMGPATTFTPLGAGQRCVGGALKRYPAKLISASGVVEYGPIVSSSNTQFGGNGIQAGQTWNFQLWYRDNAGGCANSNLTNALKILFYP